MPSSIRSSSASSRVGSRSSSRQSTRSRTEDRRARLSQVQRQGRAERGGEETSKRAPCASPSSLISGTQRLPMMSCWPRALIVMTLAQRSRGRSRRLSSSGKAGRQFRRAVLWKALSTAELACGLEACRWRSLSPSTALPAPLTRRSERH